MIRFFGGILFGAATWLLFGSLSAQPFDAFIPLSDSSNQPEKAYFFSEGEEGILFVKSDDEGVIYILDSDLTVEKSFRVFDLPPDSLFSQVGFTYRNGELHICYENKTTGQYQVLTIYPEEQVLELFELDMTRLEMGSVYWGAFTYEGILHVVRLPRGSSILRLCKFRGGEEFDAIEYEVQQEGILGQFSENLTRIDEDNPPSFENTYKPGKLYHSGNRIFLSLEQEQGTFIITVNLQTGSKDEYLIPYSHQSDTTWKNNSLLMYPYCYQVSAKRDSLIFSVSDLKQQEKVRKYAYGRRDPIDIRFDVAAKEMETGEVVTLQDTDEFLFELSEVPTVALNAVSLGDSLIQIDIGGVLPTVTRGLTGIILKERIRKSYFSSVLKLEDHSPVFSMPEPFVNRRFPPPMHENKPLFQTFTWNGKRYFGYFDEGEGGFYLSQ